MAMTDRALKAAIKAAKAEGKQKKISDGGGLHLLVTERGGTLWRLAYRFGGKQKTLALGQYPIITLEAARQKRDDAKRLLDEGKDPGVEKKLVKLARQAELANTFSAIAEDFLAKRRREGIAQTTLGKKEWLLSLVMPDLGQRPIKELTPPEILVPLRKIDDKGNHETARRARSLIGEVCRYAVSIGAAAGDPTVALRGALTAPTVNHQAALVKADEFGSLVRSIWAYEGRSPLTKWALQLMVLLYPRPGELRMAEWAEFDLKAAVWTLPASRTKMRREHKKPLSLAAVAILGQAKDVSGHCAYVFPALHSTQRCMSENTMNTALRRMGYSQDEATSHGFRASASSLLNESGLWNPDAIEIELSHLGADQIREAYRRGVHWDERVKMAEWWADFVNDLADK